MIILLLGWYLRLYTGYQLSKTGKRILIVESTNRWGVEFIQKKKKGFNLN